MRPILYTAALGLCLSTLSLSLSAYAEEERPVNPFYVGAEGGSAIIPFPTGGAVIGAYLNKNWFINASYTEGSYDIDDTNLDWNYAEVRAKYFFGDSLYLNVGVGQRRFEFDMHADSATAGEDKVHLQAQSMTTGLSIGLGNQWEWHNLRFGCEWLGGFLPLGRKSDTASNTALADDSDANDFNDTYDRLAEKPHYAALRVQLGIAF